MAIFYTDTGSLNRLEVSGSAVISGSLTVTNTITAQTLIVQTITSSVLYTSGSNIFGNSISDTHQFTGSVSITGSLTINGTSYTAAALTITNRQTASYTLALTDADKLVEMNVATANNLTVPLNSSVAFAIGTKIDLAQYGAGQTTVVATSGVTVRSAGGALKLAVQYSGASLVKIATNEWYLFGDITV